MASPFRYLQWLPVAAVWGFACANLSLHWSANPIYAYGWFVPVFALWAAMSRWKSRPEPGASLLLGWVAVFGASAALLPTWTFAQPNPDWSLIAWMLCGEAVVMTLGVLALVGGWAWVRHFAFPVCFIFTAVPCPHVIEVPMTIGLMRTVAAVTVELLNILGVAAVQHGNVIEVRGGLLGIDEACSGVRSLQAALTASLFIGETFRFSVVRRAILLFAGLIVALATNVGRTFFLSWTASHKGLAAVESWHDPAGFVILTICFAAIWLLAIGMSRGLPFPRNSVHSMPARVLPRAFTFGFSAWMIAVLIAVEIWYHDPDGAPESSWSLIPPKESTPVSVSEAAARQLQCDRLGAHTWRESDGSEWLLYFLEWRPGPLRSRVLARVHRPDICLSSVGLKMIEDRGKIVVEANGYQLAFHAFLFEQNGRPLFVYYGLWQSRSRRGEESGALSESEHVAGLQAVKWRERHLGQQVAELAVTGYSNAAQADAGFQQILRKLLVRRLPNQAER